MLIPRSLIHRLYLLIALAVTPALAVLGVREWQTYRTDQERLKELALNQAELIARENAMLFLSIRQTLGVLAATDDTLGHERCSRFFHNIPPMQPLQFTFWVARPDGDVICHTMGPDAPALSFADRRYFREALKSGLLTMGSVTISRFSHKPVLPFAMPFTDRAGRISRVVGGAVDLENLRTYFDQRPLAREGRLTVADWDGIVIYRSSHDAWEGRPLPEALKAAAATSTPGMLEMHDSKSRRWITGYVPSAAAGVPLFHAVSLDADAQLTPARQAAAIGIFLLLLSVAVAVVAASIGVGVFIRRPVGKLIAAAGRWTQGDFSVRVPVEGE
ncbi:MAG: hypothetical protein HGA47_16140, partial [Zoogloea sp.]|nr:hypothetical protein [Zoogloea sp.]